VPIAAFAQALAAALGLSGAPEQPPNALAALTPREKAALVVVSGLPAPRGAGGVLVRRWDRSAPRPRGALVFVDQEGGEVRAFPGLPPEASPAAYSTEDEAWAAGHEVGRALRAAGIHVDLAPVVDLRTGPLGARHFRRPGLALAFARGLEEGGVSACVKHFPGLGTATASTDDEVRVPARIVPAEIAAFRAAMRGGVDCVMTSHAVYRRFGWRRGVTAPEAYATIRETGYEGLVVTDSLSIVSSGPWAVRWAVLALRAGADMAVFTSPVHARRAVRALVPLARRGELDEHVRRVLDLRRGFGLPAP
jgi:beta-N-acetylhexosaminidase